MSAGSALLRQAHDQLLRQKRLNAVGFFVPLAVSSWVLSLLALSLFSFPWSLSLLPPFICCGFLGVALWKAQAAVNLETIAALIDDKVGGKDRFLTLISASQETTKNVLYAVVQRQTERLTGSLQLDRDLPFSLERRALFSLGSALGSLLLLFLLTYFARIPPFSVLFPHESIGQAQQEISDEAIKALEEVAHRLLQQTSTPQEQMIGVQLSSLAQQLQDPTLSRQEKQQLIEETRKRLNLDLPLPQILPFDLEIFASKGKDGHGKEDKKNSPPQDQTSSANTGDKEGQSQQSTSVAATGPESRPHAAQDRENIQQPQSPQEGGGITFNFPQNQEASQARSPHDASGIGQQSSQEQPKDGLSPGTDPTRLGGGQNDQAQNQTTQKGDVEGTVKEKNKRGEGGVTVGQGRGQRFLQPGEQPGGGFLTRDAQFVKVRVPIDQNAQADEGGRTANNGRATPKTPYSNAPLKEAAPEQAQGKQPIPLEYRAILKD